MKKALLVLVVLIGLGVAADLVIVKFWPDTKAGEYALTVRDTAVEWYGVTKDFWVEQWHRFRPEEPERKLTERALDGKIVMVYVFSESNEDSVALLPRIESVWSAYKSKPFVVIGSHRGGKSAKVASIIKKSKVTFSVYEDAGRTQEPGAGGRYPIVYVVDDTGRMIYRGRSDLEATEAVVTAIPDVGKKKRKR